MSAVRGDDNGEFLKWPEILDFLISSPNRLLKEIRDIQKMIDMQPEILYKTAKKIKSDLFRSMEQTSPINVTNKDNKLILHYTLTAVNLIIALNKNIGDFEVGGSEPSISNKRSPRLQVHKSKDQN